MSHCRTHYNVWVFIMFCKLLTLCAVSWVQAFNNYALYNPRLSCTAAVSETMFYMFDIKHFANQSVWKSHSVFQLCVMIHTENKTMNYNFLKRNNVARSQEQYWHSSNHWNFAHFTSLNIQYLLIGATVKFKLEWLNMCVFVVGNKLHLFIWFSTHFYAPSSYSLHIDGIIHLLTILPHHRNVFSFT